MVAHEALLLELHRGRDAEGLVDRELGLRPLSRAIAYTPQEEAAPSDFNTTVLAQR